MSNAWMVRAGRGGYVVEEFETSGCVAIGWSELSDLKDAKSKDEIRALVEAAFPDNRPGQTRASAGQVGRFVLDVSIGDPVLTYDSEKREFLVGEITGDYKYDAKLVPEHPHTRTAKWIGRVSRDDLTVASRNTLGAIQTLFALGEQVWGEISGLVRGEKVKPEESEEEDELEVVRQDQVERAREFIKDRVQRLDWDDMQELVAEGYSELWGTRPWSLPRAAIAART